ncbi:hypothetical protein FOYG_08909 [Fusarium oxysporum NRRL 32931]|uniref:Uncharacterized protein n=1 Tax=Fusarium oxysporum NRRL 32931 TaxID=660029 RepID=W9IGQ0_FUSOX|nr:hypothetical protein FOYG_08909 [Fusarium oxysporum NRRL 32931]
MSLTGLSCVQSLECHVRYLPTVFIHRLTCLVSIKHVMFNELPNWASSSHHAIHCMMYLIQDFFASQPIPLLQTSPSSKRFPLHDLSGPYRAVYKTAHNRMREFFGL